MRDGAGVEDVKIRTKILDWCKEQQSCESCISDKEKQQMTTSSHQLHFFFPPTFECSSRNEDLLFLAEKRDESGTKC